MQNSIKRPSFQFYPGDWLKSTSLRSCSTLARGLWIDMMCLMHEGTPYGYLKVNQKVIHPLNLSRMVGLTVQETEGCLEELELAGVVSLNEEKCYYSKRMIRDEELRRIRAEAGKLGGNPKLMGDNLVNLSPTTPLNQNPTPSSSTSSSPSSSVLGSNPKPKKPLSNKFDETVLEIFEFWKETLNHPKALLDKKRSSLILARLKEGYTVDRIKEAIRNVAASDFHMGKNEDGRKYDDLNLICRSGAQVDKYADMVKVDYEAIEKQKRDDNFDKIWEEYGE